jgi:hypothetical protein
MAENRFAKYKQVAPQVSQGVNRFTKYRNPAPIQDASVASPQEAPREFNTAGKGDLGLGAGEVAASTYAEDAAKSFGTGVAQGGIGIAGMIGDTQNLVAQGAGYIADKFGASPETNQMVQKFARRVAVPLPTVMAGIQAPTSQQITAGVEEVAGPMYKPQTVVGEYANTAGQFAPNAALGPGRLASKAGVGLLSAGLSETAGQMTKGSEYETAARVAGGLVGGLKGVKGGDVTKQIAKDAPAHEAVKQQTDTLYKQLRDAGVVYDTKSFNRSMSFVASKLKSEGIFQQDAPRTLGVVERLSGMVNGRIDFTELESVRKQAGAILREGPAVSNTDKMAAGMVLEALDQFATRAPLATNGKIPANQVAAVTKQARELARRNIISRDLEDMVAKAETYQSGSVSGIRNQVSNYLRSKKGKSLTAQERAAFMEVSKGTTSSNLLNILGKFGVDPTKLGNNAALLPAAGAGAAYALTQDPVTAAGVAAIGTGAKFAARGMANRSFDRAKGVVLAGRDKQKTVSQAVAQRALEARARALLAAESGRVNSATE